MTQYLADDMPAITIRGVQISVQIIWGSKTFSHTALTKSRECIIEDANSFFRNSAYMASATDDEMVDGTT